MKKSLFIVSVLSLGIYLGMSAYAQPAPPGESGRFYGKDKGTVRIIKGTLDKVAKDEITVSVESIFIPRQGELENPPRKLEISIGERFRAVKGMDKTKTLEDFSVGDKVVVIATYDEEKGYVGRAIMDPESALKFRQKLGQAMQRRQGRLGGRPGGGFDRDRMGRFGLGARIPPAFTATFLGLGDNPGEVRLRIEGFYRPRKEEGARPPEWREPPQLPEAREVVVKLADKAKIFKEGERAELSDFAKGEKVVVMIRGLRFREQAEPVLLILADEQSAEKFRELLRERLDNRPRRFQQ